MPRITLKQTLAVALAASAFVVPVATAQASAGPTPAQDLRGEHAQDAARIAALPQDLRGEHAQEAARLAAVKQDLRGEHARDAARGIETGTVSAKPPVYWSYHYQASKPSPNLASAPAPKPTDGDSDIWLILAIALGTTGVVAGTALTVSRRSRVRVPA